MGTLGSLLSLAAAIAKAKSHFTRKSSLLLPEPKLPLKLFVDEKTKRVVLAEASGDLTNSLFSFLTLPLGTAIRLLSKNQPAEIGSISNLYQSVENFGSEVFWNHTCKTMLLSPRNPCEALCQKLKLNIDDSEPTRYFMCRDEPHNVRISRRTHSEWWLSTFPRARCSCGKLMDKEMELHENSIEEAHGDDDAFVKRESMYLIFDDLKVLKSSPGSFVQQHLPVDYKNFDKLTEFSPSVGMNEILDLLKQALTSKSPLSDVFLANGESKQISSFSPKLGPKDKHCINGFSINLKVTVIKSKKKILYAEADGDFVDFLFSFLTTPLGSILKLLNGNCSLGCMNNLYKSVKDLDPSWFAMPSSGTALLNPPVAYQFGCKRQPLMLFEEATPSYWNGLSRTGRIIWYKLNDNRVISKKRNLLILPDAMKLHDPRSPYGTRNFAQGFVRKPSLFVVWDDLQVTPLANTSSVSFMQNLNVPLDDLEEHVVSIGETEALNLLGASLTSKAALTDGLFYLLKKPKK